MYEIKKIKKYDFLGESTPNKCTIGFNNSNLIKTIVFDLGGVFFTNGTYYAVDKIQKQWNIKNRRLVEFFFGNNPASEGNLVRLGLITMDEFEDSVSRKLCIPDSEKRLIRELWFSSYTPNYLMEDVVKTLSRQYRLIVFSGNIKERIEYLDDRYDFLKYFDEYLFSYDYQIHKGDKEFYYELINCVDCDPENALLIDDSQSHIDHAESLGLKGIKYTSTEQMLSEFQKYNINMFVNIYNT
ncbi:MAG: HAD hydrolase-like protein [Candidatus Lokiarchaeota archaeon]|nr:HAD hydrolase-like protein [Candidatus Lokiarchaeota archaeon]MBD3339918.1 HAD hydrolase-like protein [Candidatus Lokiarchaeota archaeon]